MRTVLPAILFASASVAHHIFGHSWDLTPPETKLFEAGSSASSTENGPESVQRDIVPSPDMVPTNDALPKCGMGYTYCGYMLASEDHNFSPAKINQTFCDDGSTQGLCIKGVPKTSPDEAVFICMDEKASIKLACACSGKCLNEKSTNNIAHCETPCSNAVCPK